MQPGEVGRRKAAVGLPVAIRTSAPDENVACHRVDVDPGFIRIVFGPGEGRDSSLDEHVEVPMPVAA